MEKREAELKAKFMKALHEHAPHFVVQLYASAGSPDRSITGDGRTTNWEFKHGTPDFNADGLQCLTCMRLNEQGHCRYVVWQEAEDAVGRRTMIVTPRAMFNKDGYIVKAEAECDGFDVNWLVARVLEAHRP